MLSTLWQCALLAIRWLCPYPDLLRRIRFRRAAYGLVVCEPWPGEQATGADAAQLALMHLLDLQRQVRRAARGRHREAAALLARSAVETCILGQYCLHSNDAPKALKARDAKVLRPAMANFVASGLVSQQVVDEAVAQIGAGPRLPSVYEMAELLEAQDGNAGPKALYREYYTSLSHFFAHPSGATLTRHVRSGKKLRRRAEPVWPRRAAVRLADACTGILAAAVAQNIGSPAVGLSRHYALAHAGRITPPAVSAGIGGLLRSADWRRLPGLIWALLRMRRYLARPGTADDPEREDRVRREIVGAFRFIGVDPAVEALLEPAADEAVTKILASWDQQASAANGG